MNKSKIIKWVLLAIPLFLITKCGIEGALYTANKTPTVNPHPTQKLRIYGKFPLEKDVSLNISSRYVLQNPKCQDGYYLYGFGWLMHDNLRETYTTVKATRTANGDYEAVLYKDYYKPGFCDWKITFIGTEIIKEGFNHPVGNFTSFTNENVPKQIYTLNCAKIITKYHDGTIFKMMGCDLQGIHNDKNEPSGKQIWDIHNSQTEVEVNFIDKGYLKDSWELSK